MSLRVWLPLNGDLHNQGLNNATVTNNGATVNTSGKIGSCYSFDGTNQYFQFNNLNIDGWEEISVACWCKAETLAGLFTVRSGGTHNFRLNADSMMFRDTSNSTLRTVNYGVTIPANTWLHLVCTYHSGEIYIYLNGAQIIHNTTYYHSGATLNSSLTETRIGRNQTTSGNTYYNGFLNDVRIYDHALSAMEIKEIARGLVLHYPLNHNGWANLDINNSLVYDISGYCNNGTEVGTFTYSTDTPKYRFSTTFSGSASCIKVNENSVMAQYAQAMTINLWAKASSWAANTHFFSCTESGGFNTEAGNSGYLRFSLHVCTDAAQTSYAYKYDSNEIQLSALPTDEWVMLTWIYDTTGTRTYINGQLHHTYTNTSYGIHFNRNARLFLGCEASGANPTTPYFNGKMSDFRMYYTALSAQDILSLYHNSAFIDEQGNIHGAIH